MRRATGRGASSGNPREEDEIRAAVRSLFVLWACSRDLEYDAQVAGTRAWYLHQMITQYEDVTPFLRIVEKAMSRTFFCTRGRLFEQSVELLTLFAADGNVRARDVFDLKTVRKSRDLLRYLYDCNEDIRRYAARLLRRRNARVC